MGTEGVWVPLVISALGAGASAYNTRETAKEADEVAAQGIRQQAKNQEEADSRVNAEVNALEQSSPEASRAQATENFLGQLKRTRGQAVAGGPSGASSRYNADLEGATNDVSTFGTKVADTLARINAPGLQRQAEGQGFNRLSSDLSTIGRNSGADAFLNDLRLRGVKRNPWIDAGASVAGGVSGGMASSGYGSTKYGAYDPRATRRVDYPVSTPPYAGVA